MAPLDGEMLGLEEDMVDSTVVDIRPQTFLRAMRDTGDWIASAEAANLTMADLEVLCQENPKFDLAVVECQLEYHEEQIIRATEAAFDKAKADRTAKIAALRQQAMQAYKERHP